MDDAAKLKTEANGREYRRVVVFACPPKVLLFFELSRVCSCGAHKTKEGLTRSMSEGTCSLHMYFYIES